MLKRTILAILVFLATTGARAFDYTDVYYVPAESGWGLFLVQSDATQFVAFFVYGSDGKPTWFVASLVDDGAGTYSGSVYATTGTYFPLPWNPSLYSSSAVGTAQFKPTDNYRATFGYSIAGASPVSKTVQRQTLSGIALSGTYSGAISGTVSSCNNPTDNNPSVRQRFNLVATQASDQSVTLTFAMQDVLLGVTCVITGPATLMGRLYRMGGAQHSCTGPAINPAPHAVDVEELHATSQGIEGRWTGVFDLGCHASMHFSAVRN